MQSEHVIEQKGINPGVSLAPRSGYKNKGANRIKEAKRLGFWWVETEEEAIEELAREVSK